jgi:hypothetical protein
MRAIQTLALSMATIACSGNTNHTAGPGGYSEGEPGFAGSTSGTDWSGSGGSTGTGENGFAGSGGRAPCVQGVDNCFTVAVQCCEFAPPEQCDMLANQCLTLQSSCAAGPLSAACNDYLVPTPASPDPSAALEVALEACNGIDRVLTSVELLKLGVKATCCREPIAAGGIIDFCGLSNGGYGGFGGSEGFGGASAGVGGIGAYGGSGECPGGDCGAGGSYSGGSSSTAGAPSEGGNSSAAGGAPSAGGGAY